MNYKKLFPIITMCLTIACSLRAADFGNDLSAPSADQHTQPEQRTRSTFDFNSFVVPSDIVEQSVQHYGAGAPSYHPMDWNSGEQQHYAAPAHYGQTYAPLQPPAMQAHDAYYSSAQHSQSSFSIAQPQYIQQPPMQQFNGGIIQPCLIPRVPLRAAVASTPLQLGASQPPQQTFSVAQSQYVAQGGSFVAPAEPADTSHSALQMAPSNLNSTTEPLPFTCPKCPKTKRKIIHETIKKHFLTHHPDTRPPKQWKCELCERKFFKANSLRSHKMAHCPICHDLVGTINMTHHIETHQKPTPVTIPMQQASASSGAGSGSSSTPVSGGAGAASQLAADAHDEDSLHRTASIVVARNTQDAGSGSRASASRQKNHPMPAASPIITTKRVSKPGKKLTEPTTFKKTKQPIYISGADAKKREKALLPEPVFNELNEGRKYIKRETYIAHLLKKHRLFVNCPRCKFKSQCWKGVVEHIKACQAKQATPKLIPVALNTLAQAAAGAGSGSGPAFNNEDNDGDQPMPAAGAGAGAGTKRPRTLGMPTADASVERPAKLRRLDKKSDAASTATAAQPQEEE